MLKYSHREGDTEAILIQAFNDAKDVPSLFSMIVVYTTTVYREVTPATLRKVIRQVRPEWEEEMLSIAAREWKAEGIAEGMAKGIVQGKTEGKADILLRQLRRKFHDLPSDVIERMQTATIDQLDDWSDRILDAKTLDEVFE